MISPPKFNIDTNSKKPNINLGLICSKEQILFGLMRMKNLNYNVRDSEKRLIDFIYGKQMHEKIKTMNAELILNSKTNKKYFFDYDKNFKEHKKEICEFYKIDLKQNLNDEQIKEKILEQINLSFLK